MARWSSPGLIRPSAAPGDKPIMRASNGYSSLSACTVVSTLSSADRTTASGWSGVTPAQLASSCW